MPLHAAASTPSPVARGEALRMTHQAHRHAGGVPRREEAGAEEGDEGSGSEYETGSEEESSSVSAPRVRPHQHARRCRPTDCAFTTRACTRAQEEEESFGSMRRRIFAKSEKVVSASEKQRMQKEKDETIARTLRALQTTVACVCICGCSTCVCRWMAG